MQEKLMLPCERWRSEWHRNGGAMWWRHHTHTPPSPLPAHLMTRSPPPSPWADWATPPHSWLGWSSWWEIQNHTLSDMVTWHLFLWPKETCRHWSWNKWLCNDLADHHFFPNGCIYLFMINTIIAQVVLWVLTSIHREPADPFKSNGWWLF